MQNESARGEDVPTGAFIKEMVKLQISDTLKHSSSAMQTQTPQTRRK